MASVRKVRAQRGRCQPSSAILRVTRYNALARPLRTPGSNARVRNVPIDDTTIADAPDALTGDRRAGAGSVEPGIRAEQGGGSNPRDLLSKSAGSVCVGAARSRPRRASVGLDSIALVDSQIHNGVTIEIGKLPPGPLALTGRSHFESNHTISTGPKGSRYQV